MSIIDSTGVNPTVNNNIISTTQTVQNTNVSTNFTDALNEALRWQMLQAGMTNIPGQSGSNGGNLPSGLGGPGGLGGIAGLGGSGSLSGPGAMIGVHMPSVNMGLENALIATAENGEMSGAHLMLFMMIMMMQTSDGGNELAPIMQVLAQMLTTQASGQATNPQINNMWNEDTDSNVRRMVNIALNQVGYQERNGDGSIGNGNFTQFGAWYGMNSQPWCAMFVSWAADQAGILNDIVPRHASTSQGVAAYQARGLYAPQGSGYFPREGDAIYFRNSAGQINHVGIVVAFDPATQRVFTVEGNTNNAVHIRHYDLNNPRIHGFGRNGGTSFGSIPASSTSGDDASIV